jgi:hypothetical protein
LLLLHSGKELFWTQVDKILSFYCDIKF